jgi:N-hydroxyarylamine O-acetyltransferase
VGGTLLELSPGSLHQRSLVLITGSTGQYRMERAEVTAKYLQALGLEKRIPDSVFLCDMTQRHVAKFAFCSVGPRLGDDLPLSLESLYQRIVVQKRGGYCFEQNGLFYEVLEELGFTVKLYLCRVIHNQDIHPGLTHRITMVKLDGERYVADVGFGPMGPRMPVSMSKAETRDEHRVFRIAEPRTGEFHMQTLKDGEFYSLYRFELARYGQMDCELGHFYSHKHPKASFVNDLVASRIMDHEIRSLRNQEYWVITTSGEQKKSVRDALQLKTILRDEFDIQITSSESRYLFENSPVLAS